MSSATIDSTTCVAARLFSRPCTRLSRTPDTMTSSSSSDCAGVVVCCATAVTESDSAAIAEAELNQGFLNTMNTPKERTGQTSIRFLILRQMLATSPETNQEPGVGAA